MPNTYTKLHICVFAVKYRAALIHKEWKEDLHKYITGIFQKNDHKMLQINSMPDHIHILIGMRPHQSISALVQNVKTENSKWVKAQKFCKGSFSWQDARLDDAVGQGYAGTTCVSSNFYPAYNLFNLYSDLLSEQ